MSQPRTPDRSPWSRSMVGRLAALLVVASLGVAALIGGADEEAVQTAPTATSDPADPAPPDDRTDDAEAVDAGAAEAEAADAEAEAEPALGPAAAARQLERREAGDPRALGDVDAPVVMIEWSDFQCPFCGAFARDTKPFLIERYVDDGLLRLEWRDLPVLGEESVTAAVAARAAAEQDAFWAFHDAIYAVERERNVGALGRGPLLAIAAELGLDTERFAADLEDPDLLEATRRDRLAASQLGFDGTPSFLIHGRYLIGGHPREVFVQAIEMALAEAAEAATP